MKRQVGSVCREVRDSVLRFTRVQIHGGGATYHIHNCTRLKTPDLESLLSDCVSYTLHVSSATRLAYHEAPVLAGIGVDILIKHNLGRVGWLNLFDRSPASKKVSSSFANLRPFKAVEGKSAGTMEASFIDASP